MPIQPIARPPLAVDLPDKVDGATRIKYRAYFATLTHTQDSATGTACVVVTTVVRAHAATEEGGFGPVLLEVKERMRHLTADNTTLVDEQGMIVAERRRLSQAEWDALATDERVLFYQGDYFLLARAQPVVIDALILAHMRAAIAMGSYD